MVVAALLVSGCATVSPEQQANVCQSTDWQRYGVNDGRLGVPVEERRETFTACAEVGHPADMLAYETGRAQGLLSYCTAENGFKVGYEGRRYDRVCPPELEQDFVQGYNRGRRERPAYAVYPRIGVGIGSSGRVRTGIGVGVGLGGYWGHHHPDYYTPPYWCGFWFPGCR